MMLSKICDNMIYAMGALTTASVTAALFGLFPGSSKHYTFFVFLVMITVSLISIQQCWHGLQQTWGWPKLRAVTIVVSCIMAVGSSGWIWLNASRLDTIAPFFSNADVAIGLIFCVAMIVLSWLHWGTVIALCLAGSVLYFWFGHLVPVSWLSHPGYDAAFIMNYISLNSTTGFYWFAQTTVDDLYYLIIYAAILFGTGTTKVMLEIGTLLGSRFKGGAAGTSVVGSSMTSMVMGVAVSNVQLTGRFTIPMMRDWGYNREMSSAIEAAASTSGQIMPPVLGLVAFIVATFLGVKYLDIVYASVYPAVLYITGVAVAVIVYARANDLPYMRRSVAWSTLAWTLPTFVVSFAVVCYLLVNFHSASFAGLAGSLVALTMSQLQGPHRPTWSELAGSLGDGFRMVSVLAVLMIAIGPIGQTFVTTNLSAQVTATLMAWMPDIPLLLLLGIAALTLVLGAPLPTPVAYLIVALSMVPFLQDMGMAAMTAHFFVFYFAVFSALSPPVAVATMAAAKIAQADFGRSCWASMKLAATTLPIPFVFAYQPVLLSFPNLSGSLASVFAATVLGQLTLAVAVFGFENHRHKFWLRSAAGVSTLLIFTWLIWTGSISDAQQTLI